MGRSFCGDNNAPVAPEILRALLDANAGDALGYGEDPWTARAAARFREHFGEERRRLFHLQRHRRERSRRCIACCVRGKRCCRASAHICKRTNAARSNGLTARK